MLKFRYTIHVPHWIADDNGCPSVPAFNPVGLFRNRLFDSGIPGCTVINDVDGYWEQDECVIRDEQSLFIVICDEETYYARVYPHIVWLKGYTNQLSMFITRETVEVFNV